MECCGILWNILECPGITQNMVEGCSVKDDVQLVLYLFYFIAMGTVVTVHGLRHIRIFLLM